MQQAEGVKPGILLVLSGPSGVGKNTVLNALMVQNPQVRYSISATTRPPRPGEVDGRNYFFLSEEEFDRRTAAREFLEWAEFCGHRYGTPRSYVEETLAAGYHVVLDIDVQGAQRVREAVPDAVLVFLLPPSWDVLEARIRARGTDREEVIGRRLAVAREEIAALPAYDYVIWNREVAVAVKELEAILTAELCRTKRLGEAPLRRFFAG
ncbi:MAG TPA: guanylate kinase [Firmicutes bacterium]|nr:guanylate kinase [Bacillota bacterium]